MFNLLHYPTNPVDPPLLFLDLLISKGKQSEIWRLAASIEDHKSEIENWALRVEFYIKYYTLRSSLKEDENSMNER
ncbi:hypothetical protein Tco_1237679, partial [Tanacetum coccineum]